MKIVTLGTILASVLLSAGASLFVTHRQTADGTTLIKVKKIELVDDHNNVRASIGLVDVSGTQQPQISLIREDGIPSVLLSVNERGEGTVYFNSPDMEGKVAVGYIWGSDVSPINKQDPFGMWGLKVLGRDSQSEAIGIGNDGKMVVPIK